MTRITRLVICFMIIGAVQGALTAEELMQLDKKVETDRQDPAQVAGEWLKSKSLA